MTSLQDLNEIFFRIFMVALLSMTRLYAFFNSSPILSKRLVIGNTRGCFTLSIAMIVMPLVNEQYPQESLPFFQLAYILIKEIVIGVLLGFAVGFIFWIGHALGFYIDNQRGASNATTNFLFTEEVGSPLADTIELVISTLMFIGGYFLMLLLFLYKSFQLWPVLSFFPSLDANDLAVLLEYMDSYAFYSVLLASPIMIACFTSEIGLGLMNRFAQQLQVFFLAMPIKSAVAFIMLIYYMPFLFNYLKEKLDFMDIFAGPFDVLLK
jgi:type III secretion protein T